MNFDIPKEIADYLLELDEFIEREITPLQMATLYALMQEKQIDPKVVAQAITDLGINTDKADPATS